MSLNQQIQQEAKAENNNLLGAAAALLFLLVCAWFGSQHGQPEPQTPEVAGISSGVQEVRK